MSLQRSDEDLNDGNGLKKSESAAPSEIHPEELAQVQQSSKLLILSLDL